jgi:hypothetical protein
MKILASFLFLILVLSASYARAQVNGLILNDQNLDYTKDIISKNLFTVTNKIDSYFGDKKALEEKNGSSIRFEYATVLKEETVQTTEPDFDIKVKFRQLESKLRFKFNTVKDDEDETLQNQEVSAASKENSTLENAIYRASIGFFREQKKYWSFSIDTGVKIESQLTPFTKARGRRSVYFGETELRMANRVLVQDREGMFNYTDINIHRKLSRDFSFTYANKFVWKDTINELTTVHGPSIYQVIDDKQTIGYNFRTRFLNNPNYAITGHEVFAGYRRDLYKRWVFLELTPGISYLAESQYARIGFFKAKVMALFGDF